MNSAEMAAGKASLVLLKIDEHIRKDNCPHCAKMMQEAWRGLEIESKS